jgi:hypothetical protein
LRFVGVAERPHRATDNDLVGRFTLGRVTGHADSLIDMKRSTRNDLASFNGDSSIVDTGHRQQLDIAEPSARALKILTYSNPITWRDFDLLPLVKIKPGRARKRQKLFLATSTDHDLPLLAP